MQIPHMHPVVTDVVIETGIGIEQSRTDRSAHHCGAMMMGPVLLSCCLCVRH